MKTILILTKIYPSNDIKDGDTKVVHYFAKQWQEMGYRVLVIHNFILFPKIVCKVTHLLQKSLSSRFGAVVPSVYTEHISEYTYEGVDVVRVPIKKYVPHGNFTDKDIAVHYKKIESILEQKGFEPDIVVGHWWNPQFQLLSLLKQKKGCRTCLVVHDMPNNKFENIFIHHKNNIDVWGMRSLPLGEQFEKRFGKGYETFHCASGVPEQYIIGNEGSSFNKTTVNVIYTGTLIKRKNPATIIEAVSTLSDRKLFHVSYVGNGGELNKLRQLSKTKKLANVSFLGRVSRDKVSELMQESDIFVMISKNEAFGLVYLEAMGCGCIPVASRNEGMDGIIVDGVNGFLCEAGNATELAVILQRYNNMTAEQKRKLSDKAVETARYYTDRLAAERYIKAVEK